MGHRRQGCTSRAPQSQHVSVELKHRGRCSNSLHVSVPSSTSFPSLHVWLRVCEQGVLFLYWSWGQGVMAAGTHKQGGLNGRNRPPTDAEAKTKAAFSLPPVSPWGRIFIDSSRCRGGGVPGVPQLVDGLVSSFPPKSPPLVMGPPNSFTIISS